MVSTQTIVASIVDQFKAQDESPTKQGMMKFQQTDQVLDGVVLADVHRQMQSFADQKQVEGALMMDTKGLVLSTTFVDAERTNHIAKMSLGMAMSAYHYSASCDQKNSSCTVETIRLILSEKTKCSVDNDLTVTKKSELIIMANGRDDGGFVQAVVRRL